MLYIGVMNNTVAVKGVFTISIKKLEQTLIHMYSFQQGECHRCKEVISVKFMEVAYVYSYVTECTSLLLSDILWMSLWDSKCSDVTRNNLNQMSETFLSLVYQFHILKWSDFPKLV